MPKPAPEQRRSDADFVQAMLEVLRPTANQRESVRAKLRKDVTWLRAYAEAERSLPPPATPGRLKEQLSRSLVALSEAKRTLVRWPRPTPFEVRDRKQLVEMLEGEIERVKMRHDFTSVNRTGGRQRDLIARVAAEYAADYFPPEQLTLSDRGLWHRLTRLFYEAAGEADRDLMHVLRKINPQAPRRVRLIRLAW
jgi:hypothetical protein